MIVKIEFCVYDPITSSNAFWSIRKYRNIRKPETLSIEAASALNKIKPGKTFNTVQIFIELEIY